MKRFSAEFPLLIIIALTLSLLALTAVPVTLAQDSAECTIPDSGPWPPCATGSNQPTAPADCAIPDSGPWPPCATGDSNPPADSSNCTIPTSGPWPPCATGGSKPPTDGNDCVIPPSGPWPSCATGDNAPTLPVQPTPDLPQSIKLQKASSGFLSPVFLTHNNDGRIFVVEKDGRIKIMADNSTFLDINQRVRSAEGERGLLSMAFPPSFLSSNRVFVYYTNNDGAVVISSFAFSGNSANPDSEIIYLTIPQPFENHNGGQLAFGQDGYLYIGLGDGGAAGDPFSHGLNPETLLGSMLRIDPFAPVITVEGGPTYGIPADNPYANHPTNQPEIWAIGLRNPWRFSFDRVTGDMFIGDVGQDQREEISFQPRGVGGNNYGWNAWEGTFCYTSNCNSVSQTPPILEYDHSQGCSVTGGYIYRGGEYAGSFDGIYFYGDFCNGNIWGAQRQPDGSWTNNLVIDSNLSIASFGEDAQGNLYVIDLSGTIYKITP